MESTTEVKNSRVNYPLIEIIGALFTAIGKFVFMDWLGLLLPFIVGVIGFWGTYIIYRIRADKQVLDTWGFRRTYLKESFVVVSIFAVISIFALMIFGTYMEVILWSWGMVPLMFLYPFWGLIQQFLVLGLFTGNLNRLEANKPPKWFLVVLTAFMFGGLHYPNMLLMIGTSLLAIFYTIVFLKYRNLWPLGLFHGVLGAIFYYFALGVDQFSATFPFL